MIPPSHNFSFKHLSTWDDTIENRSKKKSLNINIKIPYRLKQKKIEFFNELNEFII
jgi:hypothetical protein